jgi:hypothetical protein
MRFIAGVLKLVSDRRFVKRQTRWLWRCDHICLKPKSDWIPNRIFKRRILWKLIPGSHQCRARGSAHRLDVEVAQNGAVFSERMQIRRNDCFRGFWSSSRKKKLSGFFQNTVPGLFHGMSLKPRSSAKIKMTFGFSLEAPNVWRLLRSHGQINLARWRVRRRTRRTRRNRKS